MFSTLLAVSVVDLRIFRIPDRILFPALGVTVAMVIVSTIVVQHSRGSVTEVLKHAAVGMVTYFAILFLFHIVYPGHGLRRREARVADGPRLSDGSAPRSSTRSISC